MLISKGEPLVSEIRPQKLILDNELATSLLLVSAKLVLKLVKLDPSLQKLGFFQIANLDRKLVELNPYLAKSDRQLAKLDHHLAKLHY